MCHVSLALQTCTLWRRGLQGERAKRRNSVASIAIHAGYIKYSRILLVLFSIWHEWSFMWQCDVLWLCYGNIMVIMSSWGSLASVLIMFTLCLQMISLSLNVPKEFSRESFSLQNSFAKSLICSNHLLTLPSEYVKSSHNSIDFESSLSSDKFLSDALWNMNACQPKTSVARETKIKWPMWSLQKKIIYVRWIISVGNLLPSKRW